MYTNLLKKKKKYLNLTVLGFLVLISCEDFVEKVEIPKSPAPIVVHSYLYPGMDTIEVVVHRAHHIGSGARPEIINTVEDAIVTITENNGNNSVELKYIPTENKYIAFSDELFIESGKKYFLSIYHSSTDLIEASVKVPFVHNDFYPVFADSVIKSYEKQYKIDCFIKDTQEKENYYQLFGNVEGVSEKFDPEDMTYYQENFNESIFNFTPLISNKNQEGRLIYQEGKTIYISPEGYIQQLTLRLYSLDPHAYNFLESIEDFNDARDDPFAEPVNLYSNLKNAYGVFGAFAWEEKVYPWESLIDNNSNSK